MLNVKLGSGEYQDFLDLESNPSLQFQQKKLYPFDHKIAVRKFLNSIKRKKTQEQILIVLIFQIHNTPFTICLAFVAEVHFDLAQSHFLRPDGLKSPHLDLSPPQALCSHYKRSATMSKTVGIWTANRFITNL